MPHHTNSAPDGYTTVAPWVMTDDTGAFLDFVAAGFGGTDLGRVVNPSRRARENSKKMAKKLKKLKNTITDFPKPK